MRRYLAFLVWACAAMAAVPSGPAIGQAVPDFRLADQHGEFRTMRSVLGPKGALLVFYRSADW